VFITTDIGPQIYWIFAVKYWSIASKFELAMAEQDINKRNRLVFTGLISGLVLFPILAVFCCIFMKKAIKNYPEASLATTW